MTVSDWLKGVASKQWHATWAIVSIPVCSVDAVAPPGPGAVEPPGAWWRKFLEGGTAVPSSEECRPGVPSGRYRGAGRCREPPCVNCANHCPVITCNLTITSQFHTFVWV